MPPILVHTSFLSVKIRRKSADTTNNYFEQNMSYLAAQHLLQYVTFLFPSIIHKMLS